MRKNSCMKSAHLTTYGFSGCSHWTREECLHLHNIYAQNNGSAFITLYYHGNQMLMVVITMLMVTLMQDWISMCQFWEHSVLPKFTHRNPVPMNIQTVLLHV